MNANLDDPLDDLFNAAAGERKAVPALPSGYTEKVMYHDVCKKCRGRGKFIGYTGIVLGDCFACKGAGKKVYRTSPEKRAQVRAKTAASSETKRVENARASNEWREAHPAEVVWLAANAERQHQRAHKGRQVWNFPIELSEKLVQYGSLTDGQLGAIRKCMVRDAERAQERKTAEATAHEIDIAKIDAAFANARSDAATDGEGVKWLKLRLDTFIFSDAPARGQWPAAILVKEGESKLGRIVGGKFLRSRECTDDQERRIVAAAGDPAAAARAYGMRTGSCSCCGRELTNSESRELGIGPICMRKYGWSR